MRSSTDFAGMLKVVFAASILARSIAARNVVCDDIMVGRTKWNFAELDKVHHLRYHEYDLGQSFISNYTFGFNICGNLPKDDEVHGCRAGTRVCGARNVVDKDLKLIADGETEYIEITGNYQALAMDAKYTSLKSISDNEGVRIEAYGGSRNKQNKVRIDFICPAKKEKRLEERDDNSNDGGDDGDGKPDSNDDFYDKHRDLRKELTTDDGKDGKITLIKWGEVADDDPEKKGQVDKLLALEWETKYACESAFDDPDLDRGSSEGGWGFFSWFFFLSFLGLVAYFCFFAWINYSRFGKSGFDMLPHADTLRELPQLLSEYARKVVNTLRGGHSSGGYSAL